MPQGYWNELLRIAGIGEEFSCILGVRVDVVSDSLLREQVAASAHRDAVGWTDDTASVDATGPESGSEDLPDE